MACTATFVLPVHLKVLIISTSGDTGESLVHPIVRNCTVLVLAGSVVHRYDEPRPAIIAD